MSNELKKRLNKNQIEEKFINLYETQYGEGGKAFYEAEKFNFLKRVNASEDLQECSLVSLQACFLDVALSGLSFQEDYNHLYLIPYGKVAKLSISPYGELVKRQLDGQFKRVSNPTIVREGDLFEYGFRDGKKYINHSADLENAENRMVACYILIHHEDGSLDFNIMTRKELEDLRKLSKFKNSVAWTKALNGMFKAKTIKHAFKTYPKMKIGDATGTQPAEKFVETEDVEHEEIDTEVSESDAGAVPVVDDDLDIETEETEEKHTEAEDLEETLELEFGDTEESF